MWAKQKREREWSTKCIEYLDAKNADVVQLKNHFASFEWALELY